MNKSIYWVLGIIAVFVLFVGSAVYYKNQGAGGMDLPTLEVNANDLVRGSGKVVLIEYSDFQCPACRSYAPEVEKILSEYGENITFVYRHFPLPQHRNAYNAAYASEALNRQGKFWEMYEELFSTQDEWAESADGVTKMREIASKLGADLSKFDADIEDSSLKNKVRNDYKSGIKIGVNSTPTFVLNGERLPPLSPADLALKVKTAVESVSAN